MNQQKGVRPNVKIIALLAILLAAGVTFFFLSQQNRFDPLEWKTKKESGARKKMVKDIIHDRTWIGRSKPEVLAVLGEADKEDRYGESNLIYYLGQEDSYFAIDSDWLIISFENGKVTRMRVAPD